jgi:hypothetical protein
MPGRDLFHAAVRRALIADGWTITHDPLFIAFGGVDLYIDLGAEKLLGAERDGVPIAVEIKSFLGASPVSDFHAALGQFLNYQLALTTHDPTRDLYLAVPTDVYATFFALPFTQAALAAYHVRVVVYDPHGEVITKWIR